MEISVEIKQGDIFLRHTKGWSWISWAIRRVTGSFWNHVGGGVLEGEDMFVIEADPPVVKKTPLLEFINPKKYYIKIVRMREDAFKDKAEYEKAIEHSIAFLQSKIGVRYDKRAIIWLAIAYTFLGIFKRVNPFNRRKEFFCSELECQSWHLTSSIIYHLFAGQKYPEAECSTITPCDIGKAVSVEYVAGRKEF